jgi:GT2 family glycosyltransferase
MRRIVSTFPARGAEPLVSLGVPVYNGELHLEAAIRALQEQTWRRLEILISDNASTDATEAICRRLAAADPRIRYVRQPANLGAARNFDFVAREARGELFAWCAHDDLRLPDYVAACAAELERRPEAVLCNSALAFLDERGRIRRDWADSNFETRGMTRPERAERLIDHIDWADNYGLIRREALLKVLPVEAAWGGDVVLSMKLLMLGDFAKVNETLFHYRVRSRPKSVEETMREILQKDQPVRHPYTEMVQRLLRVAMEAAADRAERAELMRRFLRTITELEPRGPHPCWRKILIHEHRDDPGGKPAREAFARQLLGWLAEALPNPAELRGREALALTLSEARRVLVAIPGHPEDTDAARLLIQALRPRLPQAEFACLAPDSCAGRIDLGVPLAVFPFAALSDAASGPDRDRDPELARIRAWQPDLAFCMSRRRSRRLDRLATGSGALLGFAFAQPALRGSRRWSGRRKPYDPNRRWGFLLPGDERLSDLLALLDHGDPRSQSFTTGALD